MPHFLKRADLSIAVLRKWDYFIYIEHMFDSGGKR